MPGKINNVLEIVAELHEDVKQALAMLYSYQDMLSIKE